MNNIRLLAPLLTFVDVANKQFHIVILALNQLCIELSQLEPKMVVTDKTQDLIQNKRYVKIYAGELKDSDLRTLPIGASDEVFCACSIYLQDIA